MHILLYTVIVLVLLALALYGIALLPLPGSPLVRQLLQFACVVAAIWAIGSRAGLF